MKRILSLILASALLAASSQSVVFAAKPSGGGGKTGGGATSELVGYDISWPQCGSKLPTDQAFAIVGVNGGTAAKVNPCLANQLMWAAASAGGTQQPNIQLYVNTANPGEVIDQVDTWPTSNTDQTGFTTQNPDGTCTGGNDLACSWQYGWNRAVADATDWFSPAAQAAGVDANAGDYTWWLDVETGNTWQSGSTDALARNTADLEGMTAYFKDHLGGQVGLYSTATQWDQIVGDTVSAPSNLNGLGNWRPSGSNLNNAITNCSVAPLTTGGFISLTQYVQRNIDKNHSCI